MDLLLDVNIVIDVCAHRSPYAELSAAALVHCTNTGGRVWLYTGSVQTLEYNLISELKRSAVAIQPTNKQLMIQARALLKAFTEDKQWLAALAEEGAVFDSEDPEDEQLVCALNRFSPGTIMLLTRDRLLCERYPELTITPPVLLQTELQPNPISFIDLKAQQDIIRPQLELGIHRVLHHGQYIMGPEVAELERLLAEFVGVKHAIACSSGTDALLLPLMAYGIGPGDAVFTTPFTFFATAEMIALTGATPVFVDIDPVTFNIDPIKLEEAIEAVVSGEKQCSADSDQKQWSVDGDQCSAPPQSPPLSHQPPTTDHQSPPSSHRPLVPKAIIPVDLFGLPADYDRIMPIAEKYGLHVIQDAAQAFGALYHGRRAPGLAHVGATSFFPAKPLGCYGDGGAVFTDDDELAGVIRSLVVHGKGADKYNNVRIGLNARLDTIQAAVLIEKLKIYPGEIELRQKVAQRYTEALSGSEFVVPVIPEGLTSVWAQYTIRCKDRDAVQKRLAQAGIPAMIYYVKPMHQLDAMAYLGYAEGACPFTEEAAQTVLSLPFHPYIDEQDQERIIEALMAAAVM